MSSRYTLERTGISEQAGGAHQRVLDRIGLDVDSAATAGGTSYTPGDATDWASPAPTTVQQALDRLADLARTLNGGTPVP